MRASDPAARERLRAAGLSTPDHFLDGFYGAGASLASLRAILEGLPEGTSELMCHPGHPDAELLAGSTYAAPRAREVEILTDEGLPPLLASLGIELAGWR